MEQIEKDVAKIHDIKSQLDSLAQRIDMVKKSVEAVQDRSNKVEKSAEDIRHIVNIVINKCSYNKAQIDALENSVKLLRKQLSDNNLDKNNVEKLCALEVDMTELKWRSMKNNLIFTGLGYQRDEDTELKVRDFIFNELLISDHIQFGNVHRFGKRDRTGHRSIVARFAVRRDLERKKENKVALLVRDKLYIDGVLYKPNDQRREFREAAITNNSTRRNTSPGTPNIPPIPNNKVQPVTCPPVPPRPFKRLRVDSDRETLNTHITICPRHVSYNDEDTLKYFYNYDTVVANGISLERKYGCTCRVNPYGHRLLDMCKKMNLFIANSRIGDKNDGRRICNDASMVDSLIVSSNLFPLIKSFEVVEFNPILSDVPSKIGFNIYTWNRLKTNKVLSRLNDKLAKWCSSKGDKFVDCVKENQSDQLKEIGNALDNLLIAENVDQADLNNVLSNICKIFNDSSKIIFGTKRTGLFHKKQNERPWFTDTCKNERNLFHQAKQRYKSSKNLTNKKAMKEASISYKRAMNCSYHTFQENIANDLNVKSKSDPKNLWKYLNSIGKQKSINKSLVGIEQFLKFLKN
ncbi:unnamed protein product [Mytilus coruscus]|uniref:DZIP3-like HEPN domain-containing protein n=1 Tax=Mytilus coruscus TaxID=42192 RepID=A0A6J8DE37_MYTCO|nr:unnamed protein product [Mytilus coruscus]